MDFMKIMIKKEIVFLFPCLDFWQITVSENLKGSI